MMLMGGCVLLSGGFEPEKTLTRLADASLGATHYFCVPQMADRLRRSPSFQPDALRGLKALFTGGAPNPPADIRRWLADGIPMVNGYGMTECGTLIGMPLDPARCRSRLSRTTTSHCSARMRLRVGVDRRSSGCANSRSRSTGLHTVSRT